MTPLKRIRSRDFESDGVANPLALLPVPTSRRQLVDVNISLFQSMS